MLDFDWRMWKIPWKKPKNKKQKQKQKQTSHNLTNHHLTNIFISFENCGPDC